MIDMNLLKSEERAIVSLRALYQSFGYLPFKMSKFEEYDLYAKNKDFLVSDRIITFAGSDGKLLALKPDVTLSIIKNTARESSSSTRLYYNENVYRPGSSGHYTEIMQTGIENIGELDKCDICEAVYLAAKSLESLSERFVLDVSHMGLISALLSEISDNQELHRDVFSALASKSVHEIESVARNFELDGKWLSLLKSLVDFNGSFSDAVALIEKTASSDGVASALSELSAIGELVANSALADRVKIDFSAVSNINYYNGIVFSGYVEGIADRILAGGEYSGLLSSMNRSGRAVGFAIYLDLLERLDTECEPYDVDVLLVYSDKTSIKTLFDTRAALTAEGKSVSAHNSSDVKVRYKDIVDIS